MYEDIIQSLSQIVDNIYKYIDENWQLLNVYFNNIPPKKMAMFDAEFTNGAVLLHMLSEIPMQNDTFLYMVVIINSESLQVDDIEIVEEVSINNIDKYVDKEQKQVILDYFYNNNDTKVDIDKHLWN